MRAAGQRYERDVKEMRPAPVAASHLTLGVFLYFAFLVESSCLEKDGPVGDLSAIERCCDGKMPVAELTLELQSEGGAFGLTLVELTDDRRWRQSWYSFWIPLLDYLYLLSP